MRRLVRVGMAAVLGILIAGGVGGCIHRNVSRTQSGVYVDDQAFARITPGKTSAAWAYSIMGEPSSKKKTDVGTEIWTWAHTEKKQVDGQFLIVKDDSTVTTYRKASIEVRDGIVIDKWFSDRDVKDQEFGHL